MIQEIITTTNYTIRALAMNGKKYQHETQMGNYVRYVSGYTVVDRYGQVSKHYYAGLERIASSLAGPSAACGWPTSISMTAWPLYY